MVELFHAYSGLIVFIHVLSGVVWLGGMIVVRFAVHPAMQKLNDDTIRLARTLEIMGNLYRLVLPFVLLVALSAIFMVVGLGFKHADPSLYMITHVKEGLWTLMALNYGWMWNKRSRAQKLFVSGDLAGAKAALKPIAHWMLPLNILLGLLAVYAGVMLRGFG